LNENQKFKEEFLKEAEEKLKKRELEVNEKVFNYQVA